MKSTMTYEVRRNGGGNREFAIYTRFRSRVDAVTRYSHKAGGQVTIRFATREAAENWITRKQASGARRQEWQEYWEAALRNVPVRRGTQRQVDWKQMEACSVPDFIKGRAKKKVQLIDGKPHLKEVTKNHFYYGRMAALARILGYYTKKRSGAIIPHTLHMSGCISAGTVPKTEKQRELLLKLAGEGGDLFAMRELKRQGLIKKYHGWHRKGVFHAFNAQEL